MKFIPETHLLSNNIRIILDPMDIASTYMNISIYPGAKTESNSEYGITHFIEHMLFCGSENIFTLTEQHSGQISAETSPNSLVISGRILPENINFLIKTISNMLKSPHFCQKHIEREKNIILTELRRNQDNPLRTFKNFIYLNLFAHSGLDHAVEGTPDTITAFTQDMLLQYWSKYLNTSNIIIGISGKITNSSALLQTLEDAFAWISQSINTSHQKKRQTIQICSNNPNKNQKNTKIQLCIPRAYTPNLTNRYKTLCTSAFKTILQKRLFSALRIDIGLVYNISVGIAGDENISFHTITTETLPQNLCATIETIAHTCHSIQTDMPPTENELLILKQAEKLHDADCLESAKLRCKTLIEWMHRFGVLYDFYTDRKMFQSITVSDIKLHTQDFFNMPISIFTQGLDFHTDLNEIWRKNFS